jgi:photosystem II stability/assembly factor-like uncharacterized protein
MRVVVWTCMVIAASAVLVACDSGAPRSVTRSSASAATATHVPSASSPTPSPSEHESVATVWPVDATVVWAWTRGEAVRGGEHLMLTRDAGTSWADITPPGLTRQTRARRITALFVLDADHAWLTVGGLSDGAPQTLLSTGDAGQHWRQLADTPRADCVPEFVSPARGWCVLDRATMGRDAFDLFSTGDGGTTWQHVNRHHSPPASCDKDVRFTDARLGWAVAACLAGTPPIYRTRDGGKHWTPSIVVPANGDRNGGALFGDIPVLAGRHGAVPFYPDRPQQPLIYRSSDGGTSWQPVRPPGPATAWRIDIRTPASWILLHGDQQLSTDDAGRTWRRTTMDHRFGLIATSYYDFAPVIDFPTRTTGWVVEFDTGRTWHTTTAGRSWTSITIPHT